MEPDRGDLAARTAKLLARRIPRRSFLGWLAVAAGSLLTGKGSASGFRVPGAEPVGDGWYGFCGHYFTTGSCPGPFDMPRVDAYGLPVRPKDGRRVDNLGRLVNRRGIPVGEDGRPLIGPLGGSLPPAPRTRLCEDWVPEGFGVRATTQGSWYRCCGGQIRKLTDCCSKPATRINGDRALVGYCHSGATVFCVMYTETGVRC